jgi:YVTN family beta-propeller protein
MVAPEKAAVYPALVAIAMIGDSRSFAYHYTCNSHGAPMKSKLDVLLLAFLLVLTLTSLSLASDSPKYQVTNHFAVGGEGGWDYLSIDADTGRLFISRGSHVMVLDTATGKVLGDIPDTAGVHGVAVANDLGLGITSNGRANNVTIFDLKSLKKTGEAKTGTGPDAILYDPASHYVFTFNARSNDVTVIDPAKATAIATIPLGGRPEFAVTDLRGHIFLNIEDKNEIAEIDIQKMAVMATWPLKGCDGPSGLAIDRKYGRLFSVCSNQVMTVLDAASGKLVATVPIGKRPDAAEFDPETRLVFSSNGEGTLTVIHQDSADKYSVVQTVPTAAGARTMALDPKSHKIHLVTAKFGEAPAATAEQPHPRPAMMPGTFEVLVVSEK